MPCSRPALLTQQHTPCVNACQLLPRPLFAQPRRSICLSGDHDGRRWLFSCQQMGQGSPRHLPQRSFSISAPPAPAQRRCRLLSGGSPSARPTPNPPRSSRSYRKMHLLQVTQLPHSLEHYLLSFPCNRDMEKKHPPSPGANSSSCSFHVGIYVHHSVKSTRNKIQSRF